MEQSQKKNTYLPAEQGVWIFILGDLIIFGLLFCVFLFYRAEEPHLFAVSQRKLDVGSGIVNTLLLLTSSLFAAAAVLDGRNDEGRRVRFLLGLTILCSLGFIGIKIGEYSDKVSAGVSLTTNNFFMYYFVLTGIHFVHLLIGTILVAFVFIRSGSATWVKENVTLLETAVTFWHLVDLLWIILFPLIYLVH